MTGSTDVGLGRRGRFAVGVVRRVDGLEAFVVPVVLEMQRDAANK
jgi:hypothetical protein